MPPLSAYTPFESLLFFQCLASLNARPTSFAAISDTLRKNQFVREDDAFDTNRLTPQALEELYTTLLQEGIDDALDKDGLQDGGNANPKKRKITSGASASQSHAAIIPELVTQLYARYKDRVTKEIREEEKRYRDISQEIEGLQKDALQEPALPDQKDSTGLTGVVIEPASDIMDLDIKKDAKVVENAAPSVPKASEQGSVEPQSRLTVPQEQKSAPLPLVTTTPIPPKPDLAPSTPDVTKQKAPTPTVPAQKAVPQQLQPSQPPQISTPQPQQLLSKQATPAGHIPPVVTSTPPIRPAVNGKPPSLAPQPTTRQQLSPNIQVKVPPPPQSQRPPPPPSRGAAANRNQPNLPPGSTTVFQAQQGPSQPATPTPQRQAHAGGPGFGKGTPVPISSPAFPQLPPGHQQFQQWVPNPQAGVFPATPHAPPPYNNQPMIPKQGTFVPHDAAGQPVSIAPQNHGPATPGPFPHPVQTPMAQMHPQTTPLFSDVKQQRPHRPSIDTAGSLTPWKRTPNLQINIPETPGSPPRPRPEDVSPISERAPSPVEPAEPSVKEPQKKRGRARKRSVPPDTEAVAAKAENLTATSGTKRAGSTASTRSRARSVASRDEESAADLPTAQRKIKHEAPPTPAGVAEDVELETRAGSRRKVAEEAQSKTRTKRKRGASEALEADTFQPTPSRGVSSQLVYCTRNFTRTGAPIMNDVAAHKHASIFAKPLTEREAPGYKDLIYRPQDLKSIRGALSQGNRAVAAATEAASSSAAAEGESPMPSSTPSKNTTWLAKTPELMPPKAIVNSSQLEKELIRMFANAIMFNPAPDAERGFGPSFRMIKLGQSAATTRSSSHPWDLDEGGISRDTREMCDDVEKAVTKWRAAERTTTTDEATNKSMLSLRGSSGDSNADAMDDHK